MTCGVALRGEMPRRGRGASQKRWRRRSVLTRLLSIFAQFYVAACGVGTQKEICSFSIRQRRLCGTDKSYKTSQMMSCSLQCCALNTIRGCDRHCAATSNAPRAFSTSCCYRSAYQSMCCILSSCAVVSPFTPGVSTAATCGLAEQLGGTVGLSAACQHILQSCEFLLGSLQVATCNLAGKHVENPCGEKIIRPCRPSKTLKTHPSVDQCVNRDAKFSSSCFRNISDVLKGPHASTNVLQD
jgi:hypothetical protein